jgi:hypothetical protein
MFNNKKNIGLDLDLLYLISHEKIEDDFFSDSDISPIGLSIGLRIGF